eukprot:augustus_masked-scaffold_5-processed-gene-14.16-mRNA-1 protein AED:1.00 eAED:1.00 QI:0/-1/0/0/-1/1/1/0/884
MKTFVLLSVFYLVSAQEENEICAISGAQCGGSNFTGPASCCNPSEECVFVRDYFYQCDTPADFCIPSRSQCGGTGYSGTTVCCNYDETCKELTDDYSECTPMNGTLVSLDSAEDYGHNMCEDVLAQGDVSPDVDSTGFAREHGRLHLNSTTMRLHDENNELVQLKGVTTQGFPTTCVDKGAIRYMVEHWGIQLLRVGLYLDDGGLKDNPEFADVWEEVVNIADELGIYVLLFFTNIARGDPYYYLTEEGIAEDGINATAFWQEQATKFANNTNVIYEIAYEPYWTGDSPYAPEVPGWERVKEYARVIIPAIREIDPEVIILLPGNFWGQAFHMPYMFPLEDEISYNVMYQFNFWMCPHPRHLLRLNEFAGKMPLFISSWGMGDYQTNGYCFEITKSYIELFDKYQLSWNWRDLWDGDSVGASFVPGTCSEVENLTHVPVDYDISNDNLTCVGNIMKSYFTTGKFPSVLDYPEPTCGETYGECGSGLGCCHANDECVQKSELYSQCMPVDEEPKQCLVSEVDVTSGSGIASRGRLQNNDNKNPQLRDENDIPVQLKGISSYCLSDSQMETLVEDYGATVLRLKLDVASVDGNVDLNEVNRFIAKCGELDVYCILAWTLDLSLPRVNPLFYVDQAMEFWETITAQTMDVTNLLFEITNGIGGGTYDLLEDNKLKTYLNNVHDMVNDMNPDQSMIYGTTGFGKDTYLVSADQLTNNRAFQGLSLNSKTDMGLLDKFKMYGGSPSFKPPAFGNSYLWFITDWVIQDEDGFYPENTARFMEYFEAMNNSFAISFPQLCEENFDLGEETCETTVLKGMLNDVIVSSAAASLTESAEDDDDTEETVLYAAVAVLLAVAAFLVGMLYKTKKKLVGSQDSTAVGAEPVVKSSL